ncbi:MAG TPA: hypothetical protein VML55_26040 [Planctomycetaceae bacterium]|nr:hypothetical protein [Planctomycetaceae bacterium]
MDSLKRLFERYLGVPPVDPGQGTEWTFSWRWPWASWLPAWVALLLAVAAVAWVVAIYLRDARSVPLRRRIALIALRLAAIGCVLYFLTDLKLSVDRTGLPVIVVMVDDSESMRLVDQHADPGVAEEAGRIEASGDFSEPTRLNLATGLLTRDGGEFLKRLGRRHKLRVYRFSENAVPLTAGGSDEFLHPGEIEGLLPVLTALGPAGEQTRPGPAVRRVLNDLRGTPPTAVVVLTDGIASTTDADRLSEVASLAYSRLVPLYAVGIGSEDPARDLQLYGVLVEKIAFVGDPLTFFYNLKAGGFEGHDVAVSLKLQGSDRVLHRETVKAGSDGRPLKLELQYTPTEKGEFDYVLEVEPKPGETDVENNVSRPQHVIVRQDPIRVLLADSVPRYEFRYLKHVLERESLREDGNTLKLDVVLQDADLEYAAEDQTALEHFPVKREDIFQYDVIILGDVDREYLSNAVLEHLQAFVRERGGGLILVAGRRHNPLSYRNTPLEVMLPIELSTARAPDPEAPIKMGFRPELTLEGRKESAIFRFERTEEESVAVWNQFPELYWFIEAPELKPGALAFARHPTRSGNEGQLPIIALQRFGAGKVLFHATDELYRWRFRRGDLYYGRYWIQAIRSLTRSKLLGRDKGARLTADKEYYQRGESVRLRLEFLDARLVPLDRDGVEVLVERRGSSQQTVRLTQLPHARHVFEGQLSRVSEGTYHALAIRPAFSDAPPSEDFIVESRSRELLKTSLDRADLVRGARATHGQFYTLAEAARLPGDVPAGRPVPLESRDPIPLWNRWEFLLVFAGLLTAEWLLRKRSRLV